MVRQTILYIAWFAAAVGLAPARGADFPTLQQEGYLLLDDRVVDKSEHVSLRLGPIAKHASNPLFREDRPWEVRFDNLYANVIYDAGDKHFKCFYSPFIVDEATTNTPPAERATKKYHVTPTREMGLCYAFSKDGLRWTKPELGIIELNGNKRNNLVLRGIHGAGVIYQPAEPDRGKRYKLFAGSQVPGQKRFMIVAFSADGIHWSEPMPCPEIESTGDTHNNPLWAPQIHRFVGFTREFRDQRLVMRTESADFVRWTKAVEVLRGDVRRQTYAMQAFPSHGIYLGMLAMLDTETDRVHGELAVSPNTIDWRRVCPGAPLVPNSDKPGDYDYGCVYIAKSPLAMGDDVWIYYGASDWPHSGWRSGCLALATIKRGRWAGYEHSSDHDRSGVGDGLITTTHLVCRGSKLRVNVSAPGGSLRVGVVRQEGRGEFAIDDCEPITGDMLNAEVEWDSGANLSSLVGKSVRLEFKIENGVVYEFTFAD